MRIAVAGSKGFVGGAIVNHLRHLGCDVIALDSPRLVTKARTLTQLRAEAESLVASSFRAGDLAGAHALINAAGLARPDSPFDDALVGANALLPTVHALAAWGAGVQRVVHISSAAVYGSVRALDEKGHPIPTSPYGQSKLLGDDLLQHVLPESTIYRPTSVHGSRRRITQILTRFASSPLSSVAGTGKDPTPQVLVENVAAAAVFLASHFDPPPHPVIHPWEGVTTASLLRALSGGREPIHLPAALARKSLAAASLVGRVHPGLGVNVRRLEMLWFGQKQCSSWLASNGYVPARSWRGIFPKTSGRRMGTD